MAIGDRRRGVMITAESARRIARAVQAYEHGERRTKPKPLRTAFDDDTPIRIARVPSAWAKDTQLSVEIIYAASCTDSGEGSGSGSGSGSGESIEAWNRIFDILEGSIVFLAQAENGCWHVVAAGCGDDGSGSGSGSGSGCACMAIGGHDLTTLDGYDASKKQILGHDLGCLKWYDTTDCGSGS